MFELLEPRLLLSSDLPLDLGVQLALQEGLQGFADWSEELERLDELDIALPVTVEIPGVEDPRARTLGGALDLSTLLGQSLATPIAAFFAAPDTVKTIDGLVQYLDALPGIDGVLGQFDGNEIRFQLHLTLMTSEQVDPALVLGNPALEIDGSGALNLTGSLNLAFSFGVDLTPGLAPAEAFFLRFDPASAFSAAASIQTDDLDLDLRVGFLGAAVHTGTFDLHAQVDVQLIDPDLDGSITLEELQSTSIDDLVTLAAQSHLVADLTVSASVGAFETSGRIYIEDSDLFSALPDLPQFTPELYQLINFDDLVVFTNISAADVLEMVERIGESFGQLGRSSLFDVDVPFALDASLADLVDFGAIVESRLTELLTAAEGGPDFRTAQDLLEKLATILGVDPGDLNLRYDPLTDELTYDLDIHQSLASIDTALAFGSTLGPLGHVDVDGNLRVDADAQLTFRLGIDLTVPPPGPPVSVLDRVFVEAAVLSGTLALDASNVETAARLGLLNVSGRLDASGSGTCVVTLRDAASGTPGGRRTMRQLGNGLLGDLELLVDAECDGTGQVRFDEIEANFVGPISGNPAIEIQLGNVFDLTTAAASFNADFTASPLADLRQLEFDNVLAAFEAVIDYLYALPGLDGVLGAELPLIGGTLRDLPGVVDDFADFIESVADDPEQTLDTLETAIEKLLAPDVDPDDIALAYENGALRIDLRFVAALAADRAVDLDLASLAALAGVVLPPQVARLASAEGELSVTAHGVLELSLGVDLEGAAPAPFVFDSSRILLDALVEGNDFTVSATIGPLGIYVVHGQAAASATVEIGLVDDNLDGRHYLSELLALSTAGIDVEATGSLTADLPIAFPLVSSPVLTQHLVLVIGDLPDALREIPDSVQLTVPDLTELLEIPIPDDLGSLIDGLDAFLTVLQDAFDGEIFGIEIPVIGDRLADAMAFLDDLRTTFIEPLRELIENAPDRAVATVRAFLEEVLAGQLGDLPGDDIRTRIEGNLVEFTMWLHDDVEVSVPIGFDIGFPALGLELTGNVVVEVEYDWFLGFGVDASGFFVNTGLSEASFGEGDLNDNDIEDAEEIVLALHATIPDLVAEGNLPLLKVSATDQGSSLDVGLLLDLQSSGDTLTSGEIFGGGITASLIDPRLLVDTNIDLLLEADIVDSALPRLLANLVVDWDYEALSDLSSLGIGAPQVSFQNVRVDLGSLFHELLDPIFGEVQKVLAPIQPVIDVLTFEIPVLNASLLDLAKIWAGNYDPTGDDDAFIKAIARVITILGELPADLSTDADLLSLGSFSIDDILNVSDASQIVVPDMDAPDFSDVAGGDFIVRLLEEFPGALDIPLLTNPANAFRLLLGQDIDLFTYEMPVLDFEIVYRQDIPIVPGLIAALFEGTVGVRAQFGFGFDTTGLRRFAATGDPGDIMDGFFVSDVSSSGEDIHEIEFSGGISIGATLFVGGRSGSFGFGAGVFAKGGFTAKLFFDLHDEDEDGKLRFEDIADEGLCIFDFGGELELNLSAGVSVCFILCSDVTLVSFDLTILNFEFECDSSPDLASTLNEDQGIWNGQFTPNPLDPLHPTPVIVGAHNHRYDTEDRDGDDELDLSEDLNDNDVLDEGEDANGNGVLDETEDTNDNGILDSEDLNGNGALDEQLMVLHMGAFARGEDTAEDFFVRGEDLDGDGDLDVEDVNGNGVLDFGEDLNHNGVLDIEDLNGNGRLDSHVLEVRGLGGSEIFGDDPDEVFTSIFASGGKGADIITLDPSVTVEARLYGDSSRYRLVAPSDKAADKIQGGSAADHIFGDDGDDHLRGGAGDDEILGEGGNDFIFGNAGSDVLVGDLQGISTAYFFIWGHDSIVGDDGDDNPDLAFDDYIDGGFGADSLRGDAGNDTIVGGPVVFIVIDVFGSPFVIEDGHDFLAGGRGSDHLSGRRGSDIIEGGLGDDDLYGDEGPDRLHGESFRGDEGEDGNDHAWGGEGDDFLFDFFLDPVTGVLSGEGNDTFDGEGGNDLIAGGGGNDTLLGGAGADTIFGMAGDDRILGGSEADTVLGGSGDDTIFGEHGNDVVQAGSGQDLVFGGLGNDTLWGQEDADRIEGGAHDDLIFGGRGNDAIIGGAALASGLDGELDGADELLGGEESDTLLGDNGTIGAPHYPVVTSSAGGAGSDEVYGGEAADAIFGGGRGDLLVGDWAGLSNDDIVVGDEGTLDLAIVRALHSASSGADRISGSGGHDVLLGGDAGDEIDGADGIDVILGDNGIVLRVGGTIVRIETAEEAFGGDDLITGGGQADVALGGTGDDDVSGGFDDAPDILLGDNGVVLQHNSSASPEAHVNDIFTQVVIGGADFVDGGPGADIVIGGADADVLRGGAGTDIVVGDHATIERNVAHAIRRIDTTFEDDGGADTIRGEAGTDVALGGHGNDLILGDDDVPAGADGRDVLLGDNGLIVLVDPAGPGRGAGADAFVILGGAVTSARTTDAVADNGGEDTISGNGAGDVIAGGVRGDLLHGNDGDDIVLGDNARLEWLYVGDPAYAALEGHFAFDATFTTLDLVTTELPAAHPGGRDLVYGDAGEDVLFGGEDADTVSGDDGDRAGVAAGNDDILFGDHGRIYPQHSALPDFPSRNFFAIDTGDGAGGQGDRLFGEEGRDILLGQQGDDRLFGDDGDDDLIGGHNVAQGVDELSAGAVNAQINPPINDILDGGQGNDALAGDNATIWRAATGTSLRFRTLTGTAMYNPFVPTDALVDGAAAVSSVARLDPNGTVGRTIALLDHTPALAARTGARPWGADVLAGGSGQDVLFGQLGDDRMQGDGSIDAAPDGAPGPTHVLTITDIVIPGTAGTLYFNVGEGLQDGDDYLEGNGGADLLFGNLGQDDLIGGSSSLFGLGPMQRPDGSDTIFGGAGTPARLARGASTGPADTQVPVAQRHAVDADVVLGDNGNIYRLVGANGAFLTFNYDALDPARGALRVIPRAVDLLDYVRGTGDTGTGGTVHGLGDIVHGESGDDFIHGMIGIDLLYGEAENDDILGEAGADWISGGTGEDGILGDDGFLLTSRNEIYGEPLYGVAGFTAANLDRYIHTPGHHQEAFVNVRGELKRTVNLEPFNVGFHDILYGGGDDDFVHGGGGDDAISGAEALALSASRVAGALYQIGYDSPSNPGNVLGFGARDPEEFDLYDENLPRRQIVLNAGGQPVAPGTPGALQFLLNFEAFTAATNQAGTMIHDGNDVLFGDAGNDWIVGGTDQDHIYGGYGFDLMNVDDNHATNGGLNTVPDVAAFAGTSTDPDQVGGDTAYGGAGRDVLIANTGADRLIDWVGEYNSYLVPFAPFGAPTVSRTLQPQLQVYLYDLSKSDGADPTRAQDTGSDPQRNGEPDGELGLVLQHDADWHAQTGGPGDPQAGNVPGGRRDVMSAADFDNGATGPLSAESGSWSVVGGWYQGTATGVATSIVSVDQQLPWYYELLARTESNSNAFVVFDYQSETDFKFAGISLTPGCLQIGQMTASGWVVLRQGNAPLNQNSAHQLQANIEGSTVTLIVNGNRMLTHTFSGALHDGLLGLAIKGPATARFDDVQARCLPPAAGAPSTMDMAGGLTGVVRGTPSMPSGAPPSASADRAPEWKWWVEDLDPGLRDRGWAEGLLTQGLERDWLVLP